MEIIQTQNRLFLPLLLLNRVRADAAKRRQFCAMSISAVRDEAGIFRK